MRKDRISALIKLPNHPAEFVEVWEKGISRHAANSSLLTLQVLRGWKRNFGKTKSSWYKTETFPITSISAYPGGLDSLTSTPEKVGFICTLRQDCMKDLMAQSVKFEVENSVLVKENNVLKDANKKLTIIISELRSKRDMAKCV